jgi:hypothetical protein
MISRSSLSADIRTISLMPSCEISSVLKGLVCWERIESESSSDEIVEPHSAKQRFTSFSSSRMFPGQS